jgi:peptidoglycan/LPS O-acetylase OafA/YrhL
VVWLGKVSYSLYMTHALVEMYFVNKAVKWGQRYFHIDIGADPALSVLFLSVSVVLSLMLGWWTWRWIEVPSRAWILRRSNRP